MKRAFAPLLVTLVLLLLLPGNALAAAPGTVEAYDEAVDQLVADGYPQSIVEALSAMGTSPLGFRMAGSPSDNEAARYIAGLMRAAGLRHVRLEPVPVDVFSFKDASVSVGAMEFVASSFGGVPPTPPEGLTGEVVYVGTGTAAEFDAAEAAYGPVDGKLVLVDHALSLFWMNWPAAEAGLRGAKGVILTLGADGSYYNQPDALASFDATYDLTYPPMVYLRGADGQWLRDQVTGATEPVTATMKLDIEVALASAGGVGYNVVGEIRGHGRNNQAVLLSSHHDGYFTGSLDNASAVATNLLMAKAMKMSGYTPYRKFIFLSTTAEEFGYTNAYYDWCIGAWYAVTHAHKVWTQKVVANLNSEIQGYRGGNLWMLATPELVPVTETLIAANPDLVAPAGATVTSPVWSWNDQWTFTAAGIPSISFWTQDGAYDGVYKHTIYHTQFDAPDLIDYDFLGQANKFQWRVAERFDRGLMPYDLQARADDLAATVDKDRLLAAGADSAAVDRLVAAVQKFQTRTAAYVAHRADIPGNKRTAANRLLMLIERRLNRALTALNVWDFTAYPHEQVLADAEGLGAAVAALDQASPDAATALAALDGVAYTWYGTNYSYDVYKHELTRHDPSYELITWGGQGHLPPFVDVMPQYRQIEAGQYTAALAGLQPLHAAEIAELNVRLAKIARALEWTMPKVRTLTRF